MYKLQYFLYCFILLSILPLAGCGEVELEKITVRLDETRLLVDIGFTGKTPYTIRKAQDGASIVLKAPDAVLSDRIPKERLISGNELISGWFARKINSALEVKFYLTGPYDFSHSDTANEQQIPIDSPYTVRIAINDKTTGSIAKITDPAKDKTLKNPLARGIELYSEGNFDGALTEFNAAVNTNKRCPLAYYYAARIRFEKKQFSRARTNLLAAIRDSSDFTDATGFLAFTLKEMGLKKAAIAEWRRFVTAAGSTGEEGIISADSIISPEKYREKLDRLKKQRETAEIERKILLAQKTEQDNLASEERKIRAETIPPDTLAVEKAPKAVQQRAAVKTIVTAGGEETGTQSDDLNQRIRSDIRKGIYGIVAAALLLTAGIAGVVFWLKKRSLKSAELVFSKEVDNFLQEREKSEEESENDEQSFMREYREKRKILTGESEPEPVLVLPASKSKATAEPPEPITAEEPESANEPGSYRHFLENSSGRQPITEEIKALVARMFREGRKIEEICRASDLTKTEVELIIAVRERHMEQLIEDVSADEEEVLDADHLYIAINELMSGGDSPREIAKKLGISTSEINFALAVMKEGEGKI